MGWEHIKSCFSWLKPYTCQWKFWDILSKKITQQQYQCFTDLWRPRNEDHTGMQLTGTLWPQRGGRFRWVCSPENRVGRRSTKAEQPSDWEEELTLVWTQELPWSREEHWLEFEDKGKLHWTKLCSTQDKRTEASSSAISWWRRAPRVPAPHGRAHVANKHKHQASS